jgi:hypothetical protein
MGIEIAGVGLGWLIAGAGAVAAGTYSVSESNDAKKSANSAAVEAKGRMEAAQKDAAELPARQAAAAAAAAQETLRRRASRTNTLLTTSMGVLSDASTEKKTLLGG